LARAARDAVRSGDPARYSDEVGRGASGSPTQVIDKLAEDAILQALSEAGEPLNVLSEEAPYVDRGATRTLIVDPVDGTKNAVSGIPFYATSLAIGNGTLSGITHGLVYNLQTEQAYYAERGKGASLDGRAITVRPYRPDQSVFTIYLGNSAHPHSYEVARLPRRVRAMGAASLELCLVACGAADVYYVNSTSNRLELRVVDIAAGALIVREAGGWVKDLAGKDLDLPLDLEHRSNLVALGDEATWSVVA